MKNVNTVSLRQMKQQGQKISALTAYDASFAKLFDQVGVDILLIGDSLGMVLQGAEDTLSVTIEDMCYHTRSVRAGTERAMVVADMPFMTYATPEQCYANAGKLMAAGANMVKLEGGDWLLESVQGLTERGVPVCGHLGLTPQSVNIFGGFRIQGRDDHQAEHILRQAKGLQDVGAQLLVLECVPTSLGQRVSQALDIPVIGIGAGKHTDGQVLVMHDLLGISVNYMPKFSKNFLADNGDTKGAIQAFINDVQSGKFPGPEHSFE